MSSRAAIEMYAPWRINATSRKGHLQPTFAIARVRIRDGARARFLKVAPSAATILRVDPACSTLHPRSPACSPHRYAPARSSGSASVQRGVNPLLPVTHADLDPDGGLSGDHSQSRTRQVTLMQAEHLTAIAAYLRRDPIEPALLRRNILVRGINRHALKDRTFRLGSALLCKQPANVTPVPAWRKTSAPAATTQSAATVASPPASLPQARSASATLSTP